MFRRTEILMVVFSLSLLGLAACATPAQSVPASATPVPPVVTLTEASNGQSVELWSGQVLAISLKGNVTTGYTWVASNSLPFLQSQGEPEYTPDSKQLGAPGVITQRFKVTGSGSGQLALAYRRPSETNVAPTQTFSVQVLVH